MIILCGHIDISIGAALVLRDGAGKLAVAGLPLAVVFSVTILAGGFIGLVNGLLVPTVGYPPSLLHWGWRASLGESDPFYGGRWIYGLPPDCYQSPLRFDLDSVYGAFYIPVPIFVLIYWGLLFALWLKYSAKGIDSTRSVETPKRLAYSGISERQVTIQVFVMNGLLLG